MAPAARLSKRREEEVTEEAEDEEAHHPVDRVDVNDDHVHVQAPAPSIAPEVQAVQLIASSAGELTSGHGGGLSLESWEVNGKADQGHRKKKRNTSGRCLYRSWASSDIYFKLASKDVEELPAAGEGPLGAAALLENLFAREVFLWEERLRRLVELCHKGRRTKLSII